MTTLVHPAKDAVARLWPAAAVPLAVLWIGLPLLFALRRLAGAVREPLPSLALLIVALLAVGMTWCLRAAAGRYLARAIPAASPPRAAWLTALGFGLPALPALVLLASLTLPETALWAATLAWLLFVAGEAAAWAAVLVRSSPPGQSAQRLPPNEAAAAVHPTEVPEEEVPPGLLQQVTRVAAADGESLHALLRVSVPRGDSVAVAHLAFCPALAAAPLLTAHAVDAAADVRLTHVETFGARLEVRLPQPAAAPQSLLIEVVGGG